MEGTGRTIATAAGMFAGTNVDDLVVLTVLFLTGLVPLALGVRSLVLAVRARTRGEERPAAVATGVLPVAGITIANGADNVSVYTPVFRTIGAGSTVVTIMVFAVGVAGWCLAASWLGSHERVIAVVERYGQWIVPVVFVVVGALIVGESGVLGRLL